MILETLNKDFLELSETEQYELVRNAIQRRYISKGPAKVSRVSPKKAATKKKVKPSKDELLAFINSHYGPDTK